MAVFVQTQADALGDIWCSLYFGGWKKRGVGSMCAEGAEKTISRPL